jgi:hypothetical protein
MNHPRTIPAAIAAHAQTLMSAKVEPATAQPGQAVTLTAELGNADNPNCGMRLHWGDGQTQDLKINQAKDVPIVARHSYAKAGNYTVMVEPKTQGFALKCLGANQRVAVQVVAPVAAKAAAPSGPTCPGGWKLDAKSVNKKTGAYTCSAKAGTAAPQPQPTCPGELSYFFNAKRGQIGCRP